jgi:hypothetical protein
MGINPAYGQHPDEFIVMEQVRPDTNAAVTAMTAVGTNSMIDGFGQRITAPTSFSYLTPVSVGGLGETLTVIQSPPVTIDGSTYVQSMTVSDRTAGAVLAVQTITGTGAATISWVQEARDQADGQGYGYQPNEAYVVGDGPAEDSDFGSCNYNPTRDGNTSILVNKDAGGPYPNPPPQIPHRDYRQHCGQPIYYRASGDTMETCIAPLDFTNTSATNPSRKGESDTRSVLCYGHRMYQKTKLGWGRTAVTRAVTQRTDWWFYAPKAWTSGSVANQSLSVNLNAGQMMLGGYWNESKIYDLADFGNPIVVTPDITDQRLSGAGGADNFKNVSFSPRAAQSIDTAPDPHVLLNQLVRTPQASNYGAFVLRNSATDIAYGYAVRFANLTAEDLAQNPFTFVRTRPQDQPDVVTFGSIWDVDYANLHHPSLPGDIYGFAHANFRIATERQAGWVGNAEYRCLGRTAHVLAALQDLYASGDLDSRAENYVPGAVSAGTYWRNAPISAGKIKQRVKQLWERKGQ